MQPPQRLDGPTGSMHSADTMSATRRPSWGLLPALFCAVLGCLPSGTWALCIEANGHVALEAECRPFPTVDTSPSEPCDYSPDGCRECRDYQLVVGLGLGIAGHRQFAPETAAPAALIPTYLNQLTDAAPALAHGACSSLNAPQIPRTTVVLRI